MTAASGIPSASVGMIMCRKTSKKIAKRNLSRLSIR